MRLLATLLTLLLLGSLTAPGWAAPAAAQLPRGRSGSAAAARALPRRVSSQALRQRVLTAARKIPEFHRIAQLAEAQGFDIYLLGGAAGNLVNHLRLELLQQAGDPRLRASYFAGPLAVGKVMNLFTQDVDLVLARKDGRTETVEEISRFQELIRDKVKGLELDVRGLNTAKDDLHTPLRNDREFFAMHHNSVDYLMVQLNARTPERAVRDLSAWDSPRPPALEDLARGRIRFFPSAQHAKSKLARGGGSPDIKHVLRLLIKAARYDLELDPASKRKVQELVDAYSPNAQGDIFARWLGQNAKKLAGDAIDLERTWKTLDELQLRQKLTALSDQGGAELKPVAELFSREPLKSARSARPPAGQTAAELGISVVTHTTSSLEAWNSITRTPYRQPNFFRSTQQGQGGMALHGDGVYAMVGETTHYKDGHQVRLRLMPDAVEGVDFKLVRGGYGGALDQPFVVILSKAKLQILDAALKTTPRDMIRELLAEKSLSRAETRDHYLGQLLRRRLSVADRALYAELAHQAIAGMTEDNAKGVLARVFAAKPLFARLPELAEAFIAKLPASQTHLLLSLVERCGQTPQARRVLALGLRRFGSDLGISLAQYFFPQQRSGYFRSALRELIESGDTGVQQYLVWKTFTAEHLDRYPAEAKLLLGKLNRRDWITSLARAARERLADQGLVPKTRVALTQLERAAEARLAAR